MQLPGITEQKIMVAGHIEFLQAACKNGIDAHVLMIKLDEIRHVFRSARLKDQMGFIDTCKEGIEELKKDGSPENCKLMMRAVLYNLMCHLDYLNLIFPDK